VCLCPLVSFLQSYGYSRCGWPIARSTHSEYPAAVISSFLPSMRFLTVAFAVLLCFSRTPPSFYVLAIANTPSLFSQLKFYPAIWSWSLLPFQLGALWLYALDHQTPGTVDWSSPSIFFRNLTAPFFTFLVSKSQSVYLIPSHKKAYPGSFSLNQPRSSAPIASPFLSLVSHIQLTDVLSSRSFRSSTCQPAFHVGSVITYHS
jgi:hypothetical protein